MNKLSLILPVAVLLAVCMPAVAEEVAQPQQQAAQPEAVRQWLELQSSGKAASSQPQPLSGAAMSKIHERYIKSFSNPIPANYEHAQALGK